MRALKRILSLAIVLATMLTLFTSCGRRREVEGGIYIRGYTVVRSAEASENIVKAAKLVKKEIRENLKVGVSLAKDSRSEREYEILIGNTERAESTAALEKLKSASEKRAFSITFTENKIVIVGHSDDDVVLGVKSFINKFVKTSNEKGVVWAESGYSYAERTGNVLYFSEDLDAVVIERSADIFHPRANEGEFSYGKIIKLEHSGENNGMLFATHETLDGCPPPVYCSLDDGRSWEIVSRVKDELNTDCMVGYQSYIYELPADVGEYKEGTLLFSGCSRTNDKTVMVLYASTDLGRTWKTLCNVDTGGGNNKDQWESDGLWEPVLMYENGRLYCFYSDEREDGVGDDHTGGHSQKLVYKYTEDMKSWSDARECVASENPKHRPGMVSLTKMGNGKWALAYELCASDDKVGCQIYLKLADTLDSWNAGDLGTPVLDKDGKGIGSGPAIAWTKNGGDCGTLFITAHHSESSKTGCDLFISFDYGKTFVTINNPISVARSSDGVKCVYSPGFFVDESGDLYYVNNPEAYKEMENERFVFVKIKCY